MADYDVAVIGAGAAGVAAATTLAAAGQRVVLIEASARVGGRARTETIDGMALDLGCGWLHSAEQNPLVAVAAANGFAVDRSRSAWERQYRDLGFTPAEQAAAHAAFEAFGRRLVDAPPPSDRAADALTPGEPWNQYIEALSGYLNGAGLDRLSVADYTAYDNAATDNNWRLPAGYGTLIAALCPAVRVLLAHPVRAVAERGARLAVELDAGSIACDRVVVTMSTAVLAGAGVRFPAALDAHRHAAACLPLGLADKLYLKIADPAAFEVETHLIGDPRRADTGSYYLRPLGAPVVEVFVGGPGAVTLERDGVAAAFAHALDELAALLGSDVRRGLTPLTGSRWARETHIGGAYSHALPGHAGARATLAAPVDARFFFAGEATHPTAFTTAHGAWESGIRAAREVIAAQK